MAENREQKAARRYRHGSEEYRKMRNENIREVPKDMKRNAMRLATEPVKYGKELVGRAKKAMGMRKGGKCYAGGGMVSKRADGIAKKGKTHCKMK